MQACMTEHGEGPHVDPGVLMAISRVSNRSCLANICHTLCCLLCYFRKQFADPPS